jgi:hypothetical protein
MCEPQRAKEGVMDELDDFVAVYSLVDAGIDPNR